MRIESIRAGFGYLSDCDFMKGSGSNVMYSTSVVVSASCTRDSDESEF